MTLGKRAVAPSEHEKAAMATAATEEASKMTEQAEDTVAVHVMNALRGCNITPTDGQDIWI